RSERQLNTDDRFVFKHCEQIVEPFDFEVSRFWPDDLVDRDAGRRIDCQFGRNQVRIAWLVGLRVEPFGKDHLQGAAHWSAGFRSAFDERRQFSARAAKLSRSSGT